MGNGGVKDWPERDKGGCELSLNWAFRVSRATSYDGIMSETFYLGAPVLGSTNSAGGKTPDPRREQHKTTEQNHGPTVMITIINKDKIK